MKLANSFGFLLLAFLVSGQLATSQPANTTTTTEAPTGTSPDDSPTVDTTVAVDSLAVNSDEDEPKTISPADPDDETATPSSEGISGRLSISRDEPGANSLGARPSAELVAADNQAEPLEQPAGRAQAEPVRLNLSQVDAVYLDGFKGERETVESWHRMRKKLKKGIGSVVGSLVPYALNMSAEAKISSNCSGAVLKWVLSLNQLKSWALRMLDASGKPIAGLLEGSMTMFGNYRQCLKIRAPDDDEIEFAGEFREYFRGKYCIVQAKPWLPEKSRFYNLNTKFKALTLDEESGEEPEEPVPWYEKTIFDELSEWALAFNFVNIRYDLCLPSQCTREDIQRAINFLLKGVDLKARVLRCETDSPSGGSLGPASVETSSLEVVEALAAATSVDQSSWAQQLSQLGWLLVPAAAVAIVLVATAISMTLSDEPDELSATKLAKLNKTVKSLSLARSVSSHLNVDYDQLADDKPLALYGVRFLLVLWVVLVESAVNLKFEYLRELLMLKDLIFWMPMQVVINSTLQFDSIILLTAFTMGYKNCLNDGVNQAKALTKFVLDKYIRLMPSIMIMVALVILLPLAYRGPVWNDYVTRQSAVCQSTGWVNAVFLQNYLNYKDICLPQTWLLCVELQLVLLMAPIVYYLNRSYTKNFTDANQRQANGHTNGYSVTYDDANKRTPSSSEPPASRPFFWLSTAPGIMLLACIGVGTAGSFYNVYSNELPPTWFYTMADPDSKALYFGAHLTKLWTHLAVFAIGVIAGVECRRASRNVLRNYKSSNIGLLNLHSSQLTSQHKSQASSTASLPIKLGGDSMGIDNNSPSEQLSNSSSNISFNMANNSREHIDIEGARSRPERSSIASAFIDLLGCLLAIAVMFGIILSTHDWSMNDLPKPLVAGLFDVGSRSVWSIALIWLLYMLSVPDKDRNFSFLARALGHPAMVSLGKLSFLIYIIHPFVHVAVLAIQEQPIYSSWLMLFHILIGNMTITVILASLVSLFVEMPCRNLFRRCGTSLLLTPNSIDSGATSLTIRS